MAKFQQSFAWWCVAGKVKDPHEFIHAVAQIGYKGIEMIDEKLWPEVLDHGLKIVTMGGHQSLTDGLNKKQNHGRIADEIAAHCEKARKFAIPCLIVFSGNRNGLADERGIEITAEGLSKCKKFAEQAGVTLVLELLNSKVDHKDYQCDRTAWGVEVIRRVNSPRVKLLYDIYHMQIMEGDLIRTIQNNHQYFGHYHTAGNPGRHDLDEQQETNYPAVMRAIAATGYAGFVGQEFIPKGDPLRALKSAFDLCNV